MELYDKKFLKYGNCMIRSFGHPGMLKFCRNDQREGKNKRRTKRASLLRNPLTMYKTEKTEISLKLGKIWLRVLDSMCDLEIMSLTHKLLRHGCLIIDKV